MSASNGGIERFARKAHLFAPSAEAPRRKLSPEDRRRYVLKWASRKVRRV